MYGTGCSVRGKDPSHPVLSYVGMVSVSMYCMYCMYRMCPPLRGPDGGKGPRQRRRRGPSQAEWGGTTTISLLAARGSIGRCRSLAMYRMYQYGTARRSEVSLGAVSAIGPPREKIEAISQPEEIPVVSERPFFSLP